jgi:cytochrome c553
MVTTDFSLGRSRRIALGATLVLAVMVAMSAMTPVRLSAKLAMMSAPVKPANIASCTGCHAATLTGRPHFSPSLLSTGVLKQYNEASFVKVMATGVTPDGTSVRKPMPVFHYPKAESVKLYLYLESLK